LTLHLARAILGEESMMESRNFLVLVEHDSDSGQWVTHVPALNGLSTCGETREEALAETEEAIIGYLEAAAREGIPVPVTSLPEVVTLRVAS
jgi:predicted RNase H-like HicB family nuclease